MSTITKTILQVPMTKSLRNQASSAAKELGFSSLQESIRIFLTQIANKSISLSFEAKPVQLSTKAIKRYNKMIDDIDSGKEPVYQSSDVNNLLDQLYDKKNLVQSKI